VRAPSAEPASPRSYVSNGTLFMFAAPSQLPLDIRHVPALLPSSDLANASATSVLHELDQRIDRLRDVLDGGSIPSGSEGARQPHADWLTRQKCRLTYRTTARSPCTPR